MLRSGWASRMLHYLKCQIEVPSIVWDAGLALGSIVGAIGCALALWGLGPHLYRAFQRDTLVLAHGDLVVERRLLRTTRFPRSCRG